MTTLGVYKPFRAGISIFRSIVVDIHCERATHFVCLNMYVNADSLAMLPPSKPLRILAKLLSCFPCLFSSGEICLAMSKLNATDIEMSFGSLMRFSGFLKCL